MAFTKREFDEQLRSVASEFEEDGLFLYDSPVGEVAFPFYSHGGTPNCSYGVYPILKGWTKYTARMAGGSLPRNEIVGDGDGWYFGGIEFATESSPSDVADALHSTILTMIHRQCTERNNHQWGGVVVAKIRSFYLMLRRKVSAARLAR